MRRPLFTVGGALQGMLMGVVLSVCWAALTSAAWAIDGINIDDVEVAPNGEQLTILVGVPPAIAPNVASVTASFDGQAATSEFKTVEIGDVQRTVVLALDASNSMARDNKFAAATAAASAFINAAPEDVEIGLLTFSSTVTILAEPTADHALLIAALEGIELSKGTRVYDALEAAVGLAGPDGARSVLLLSDGKDQGNGSTIDQAIDVALDSEVVVDVVALDQEPLNFALMSRIAEATGGDVIASDPESLAGAFAAQAEALATQLLLTVVRPTEAEQEEADLTVAVMANSVEYTDTALVRLPPRDLGAVPVDNQETLFGRAFLWGGSLVLAAGLTGLLVIALSGTRGPSLAERQIAHYSRTDGGTPPPPPRSMRQVAGDSVKGAALAISQTIVRGNVESHLSARLAGAGLTLTSAEWLLIHSAVAATSSVVGLALRGVTLMVLMFIFGLVLPWAYLTRRHRRRLAAFHAQLAETLQLIAGGLSAGLSLPQAVDTVVREGSEPMAGELRRVLVEQRLGMDITVAMNGVATRMDSRDFAWVVMAIRIQREVGGNLSELLTTVSETLREREHLRRQVGVLSAEGRISAWILGALPIVMFTYVAVVRPEFIRPLLTEPAGLLMLAGAIVLLLAGFWTMSRIVKVEV